MTKETILLILKLIGLSIVLIGLVGFFVFETVLEYRVKWAIAKELVLDKKETNKTKKQTAEQALIINELTKTRSYK